MSFPKKAKDFAMKNWKQIAAIALLTTASVSVDAQNTENTAASKHLKVKALVENMRQNALQKNDLKSCQVIDSIANSNFDFFIEVYDKMKAKEFLASMKKKATEKKDQETLNKISKIEGNDEATLKLYNSFQTRKAEKDTATVVVKDIKDKDYSKKVTKKQDGNQTVTRTVEQANFNVNNLSKEEKANYQMLLKMLRFKNLVNGEEDFNSIDRMRVQLAVMEMKANPESKDAVMAGLTEDVKIDKDNSIMYYKDKAYIAFNRYLPNPSHTIWEKDSQRVKSYLNKTDGKLPTSQVYKGEEKAR